MTTAISLVGHVGVPVPVIRAWKRAQHRAKQNRIVCTLTADDVRLLWQRCEGRCVVSGLPFSEEQFPDALVKQPFAPSIDRIDCLQGYTPENTRITCVIANFAMGQWGLDVLRRLSHGVIRIEREENNRHTEWYRRQRKKLRDAERALDSMNGREAITQRQTIVALKAAITKGPVAISRAAVKANREIRRTRAAKCAAAGES